MDTSFPACLQAGQYHFQPFYQKIESLANEKNLQNPGLVHKNYTDSISKLLINANDNTLADENYGK